MNRTQASQASKVNVRYGTIAPAALPTDKKWDEYLVTPSGDNTTLATQTWIFDWVSREVRPWGTPHLVQWTRAAILGLRTAWTLVPWVSYEITDHIQGRLVIGTTVTLLATSTTELSHDARVNTTYDNTSWFWLYDIDTALVYELRDNLGNIARGTWWTQVANFDWWNTFYSNVVVDNATLTVNIGNTAPKSNVTVKNLSTLNLTGFIGNINNFTIDIVSIADLTNANGQWRYMEIKDNSTLNASGYTGWGDNYYNTIYSTSNINTSNTTTNFILRNSDLQQATITNAWITAGTFSMTGSKVQASSIAKWTTATWNITITNGQFFDWGNINMQFGTMSLNWCRIEKGSTITQNTINTAVLSMTNTIIAQASWITNSAVGSVIINYTSFNAGIFNKVAGSASPVSISNSNFNSSSSVVISATWTWTVNIFACNFSSASKMTQNSAANIALTIVNLRDNWNITSQSWAWWAFQVTGTDLLWWWASITKLTASTAGNLFVNSCKIESSSFIQHGGTGNLNVSQFSAMGSSWIDVTGGNRNYTLTRFNMSNVWRANLSWTNAAATDNMQDIWIYERGTLTVSCSWATNTLLYCTITWLFGSINFTWTTGGASLNRIKAQDWTLNIDNSVNASTIQILTITDASIVTYNTNPAWTTLQYSEFYGGSSFTLNKTWVWAVQYITLNTAAGMSVTGTTTTITEVNVEIWNLNISWGSLRNCSKKLNSRRTVTGGAQSNTHHWSATNKTSAVANTNRIDYLWVISSVPIL